MARFRRHWLAAAVLGAMVIGVLSLLPSDSLPPIPYFPGADKLGHAAFYLGLGFLWAESLTAPTPRSLLLLVILIAAYGLALEIGQRYVPGRSYDLLDALANAGGAGLGVAIPDLLRRRH